MALSPNCPWWKRFVHRRQRENDRKFMVVAIRENAARSGRSEGHALAAWRVFMAQQGEDHWRCGCAQRKVNNIDYFGGVER